MEEINFALRHCMLKDLQNVIPFPKGHLNLSSMPPNIYFATSEIKLLLTQ